MVDVYVIMNIFLCNADLCEFPCTQVGVFSKSVTSAGSMYMLPARKKKIPMWLRGGVSATVLSEGCFAVGGGRR